MSIVKITNTAEVCTLPVEAQVEYRLPAIQYGPNLSKEFKEVFDPITGPAMINPMPIELKDETTLVSRPNAKEPYWHKEWVRESINSMLKAGIIRYSQSVFHSSILIVKKPHGHGLCADFGLLNSRTKLVNPVVPNIEHILSSVKGWRLMFKL